MGDILTMSGWTQPHDALHSIVPEAVAVDYSDHATPQRLFEHLHRQPYEGVVAWSLGAQLAVRALQAGAIAPKWMILLAPPLQFVSDDAFAGGMDPVTYQLFRDGYAADAARTSQRFHGLLVKGDVHYKRIMPLLSHHPKVEDVNHWLPWLENLAEQKVADLAEVTLPPTLLVQGAEDVIVPHTQGEAWKAQFPEIELRVIKGMAHTPHHHDAEQLRGWIDAHREVHG